MPKLKLSYDYSERAMNNPPHNIHKYFYITIPFVIPEAIENGNNISIYVKTKIKVKVRVEGKSKVKIWQ